MTLIKSISGIRGTIGGNEAEGLNPINTARFTAAFAALIKELTGQNHPRIVVGRDARISGEMLKQIVIASIRGMGCDVIDIDLSTTPTVEMAVQGYRADGGIILTASHNPKQWNALKLLGSNGEFLSAGEGERVLALAKQGNIEFAEVDAIGRVVEEGSYLAEHIRKIMDLPMVDTEAIRRSRFRVAIDCVNSVGGIALPPLLEALGVECIFPLNCDPSGEFAHNPEPLPMHLNDLCRLVQEQKADVGFAVDPDVDRLAIVDERGNLFGEEYTLVAVADYLLEAAGSGNTVSNLSSTRALRDVTAKYDGLYMPAAVGEVNVVAMMKELNALIGGEGNGGIIYPELHYGRDALVGIALFLSLMAKSRKSPSELRKAYPTYFMSKQRVAQADGINGETILHQLAELYANENPNLIDGVKIDFEHSWVHVRNSNTEPIIRIYTEAPTQAEADELAERFVGIIQSLP